MIHPYCKAYFLCIVPLSILVRSIEIRYEIIRIKNDDSSLLQHLTIADLFIYLFGSLTRDIFIPITVPYMYCNAFFKNIS